MVFFEIRKLVFIGNMMSIAKYTTTEYTIEHKWVNEIPSASEVPGKKNAILYIQKREKGALGLISNKFNNEIVLG